MTCNKCSKKIYPFYILDNYLFNYNLCIDHLSEMIKQDMLDFNKAFKMGARLCINCDSFMGMNKSLRHKMIRCPGCVNGNGRDKTSDYC